VSKTSVIGEIWYLKHGAVNMYNHDKILAAGQTGFSGPGFIGMEDAAGINPETARVLKHGVLIQVSTFTQTGTVPVGAAKEIAVTIAAHLH
jgi:hypothetical protein